MSLRDQLLKAGLVTEKQVRESIQQKAKQSDAARQLPRKQPRPPSPQQLAVQRAAAEKAARDLELNRKKQAKAERKARHAEVNQMVEQHRVPKLESDDYFNFVHGNTVERIMVDAPTRVRIGSGELLIVRYRGHYALVPAAECVRIRERDPTAIVSLAAAVTAEPAADDPYKDFVVPDDLTW